MRKAVIALLLMWTGACAVRASGPPSIAFDRSTCSRCGMLISEPGYAAAVRWSDGREQLFDDIGCLRDAMHSHDSAGARFWFHDADDAGWIVDASPVFMTSARLRSPMGGGIVAYRDRGAAERAAARQSGRVVPDLAALMADAGGAR